MLKPLRSIVFSVLAACAAVPCVAQPLPQGLQSVTSVEGIDEYRLPNGLQLLLVPDDSKPTTTVNITYRVGSRHENYGETGMAHLLEHMLFKGTPTHEKVWDAFQKRGLAANGSTSFDRTNYFASFSANDDNLQWYLGWLADAMVNSYVARKDLDTEMTVVRNEMESGENNPSRILVQRTMSLMFDWHHYGNSIIGARADVENVDIPRLQAFYRMYYQPDNATLIVSGKFDTGRVLAWVAGAFGKIPKPTRKLPVLYTLDAAQDGPRSVTLRRSGGTPMSYVGYHVPAGATKDFTAAELLAIVFGDTPTGRLHKRLTQKQLAADTGAFAWSLADPSALFTIAQLAPGQDVDKAQAELLATVESVRTEPITADELARARLKWMTNWEKSFSNPETVGVSLSESVALGDWRLFFLKRDWVQAQTVADLQRVAEQYLVADNRTLATYLPTDKPQRAPAQTQVDVAQTMQAFKPQVAAAKVEAFEATPANIDARTQTFTLGGLKAALLPKGTRGDAVQAVLTLRYGDQASLAGQNEVAEAVAALLDTGTRTLTREQIEDRLDKLKTQLGVSAAAGRVTLTLSSRREHLPAAISLVGELLRDPVFPADALSERTRQTLSSIEQNRKEPNALAQNAVARLGNPYPRGDVRYARTFDEMVEDANAVTVDKLRAFHARFYGASHAEFAAVGAMDAAAVRAALQAAFADWKSPSAFARVPQPLLPVKPERLLLLTPDKQNAYMLVRLGVPLTDADADYPAFTLANHIVGSGGSSRLWKRIRESEGLSYGVGSNVQWNSVEPNSPWQAAAIYAPQNRAKVEAAFQEEVARALKDGFTAQELAEAQTSVLGFRRLSRAQDASVAGALANNLYLGRTFAIAAQVDAAIAKLTLEQVNAALRKYLAPERFVSAFAGDFKGP
ncbi:MAG: pitrilysin family protein [Burkholderiaceae bacterium]